MNLWLVGLGLTLFCTVSAESECSGDHHSSLQGKWYGIAMATNCEKMLKDKGMMKIISAHVAIETDSKLHITSNFPKEDGCEKMEMVFDKLDDGTYVHTADWGSTKKMEVVSTDCKTHAIIRAQIEHDGKTSDNMMLFAKNLDVLSLVELLEMKEKFSETAKNSGFTSEQIIFPNEVACENLDEMMPAV